MPRCYLGALVAALVIAACSCSSQSKPEQRIHFWHAFNTEETEALNRSLARWQNSERISVAPVRETFARGLKMLRKLLVEGKSCPDLARIDATWLPGLVAGELLAPAPKDLIQKRLWLPDALELASYRGSSYGVPQTIDGLALIHRGDDVAAPGVAWPPGSMDELVAVAKVLAKPDAPSLGIQINGYWYVPFARQWGAGLIDVDSGELRIGCSSSAAALNRFAQLFGSVAPPLPPSGKDAEDVTRRFRAGRLAIVISGPWAVAELTGGDTSGLAVSPLPGAPLGGQVLVVPRCAKNPDLAWKLAEYLTSSGVQADWARRLGIIPSTRDGVEASGEFVKQFHSALSTARPLPRHPVTPEIFDDLGPAVRAVVAGDAQADEALAGVVSAWSRLLERHGVEPKKCSADGDKRPELEPESARAPSGAAP